MVIVALNGRRGFLKADVVESSEWSTADVLDGVVGYEELFLEAKTTRSGSNLSFLKWEKHCRVFSYILPSTSWKCSRNSSDPHSQSHPSWTSLHTGRRPGTCPSHKDMEDEGEAACSRPPLNSWHDWCASPSAFDLHPRLHPISEWETAASCWWSLRRRTWLVSGTPAKTGSTRWRLWATCFSRFSFAS